MTPVIKRRLNDVVYKQSIRAFVEAIYKMSGILADVDKDLMFK